MLDSVCGIVVAASEKSWRSCTFVVLQVGTEILMNLIYVTCCLLVQGPCLGSGSNVQFSGLEVGQLCFFTRRDVPRGEPLGRSRTVACWSGSLGLHLYRHKWNSCNVIKAKAGGPRALFIQETWPDTATKTGKLVHLEETARSKNHI
jgi:hypothetical protein